MFDPFQIILNFIRRRRNCPPYQTSFQKEVVASEFADAGYLDCGRGRRAQPGRPGWFGRRAWGRTFAPEGLACAVRREWDWGDPMVAGNLLRSGVWHLYDLGTVGGELSQNIAAAKPFSHCFLAGPQRGSLFTCDGPMQARGVGMVVRAPRRTDPRAFELRFAGAAPGAPLHVGEGKE